MRITICVDFDGTCVEHEYPKVGKTVPKAVEILKALDQRSVQIVLFTMKHGKELDDAVNWFGMHGITLHGINRNPDQDSWTKSPKAYGNHYVDDAAIGCPLITPPQGRPYVDWEAVGKILEIKGILTHKTYME